MLTNTLKHLLSKPNLAKQTLKATHKSLKVPLTSFFTKCFCNSHPTEDREAIISSHNSYSKVSTLSAQSGKKLVLRNQNLNEFMTRVHKVTGLCITSCLGFSYMLAANLPILLTNPLATIIGGFTLTMAGNAILEKIEPQRIVEPETQGRLIERIQNPLSRKIASVIVVGGSSLMLVPVINSLISVNPAILPITAGLSVFTVAGANLYTKLRPQGQFKVWESVIYGTLPGVLSMNLFSLGLLWMIDPTLISLGLYAGTGLFAAFHAFRTQQAFEAYTFGNHDYLFIAMSFLNFKNFLRKIAYDWNSYPK